MRKAACNASSLRAFAPRCSSSRLAVRTFGSSVRRLNMSPLANEPAKPVMRTSIPGPRSQAAVKQLDHVFDTRSLNMLVDYPKCNGN
ncbi:4-aminobutyrate aminotransferase [Ilyonectria robusta]